MAPLIFITLGRLSQSASCIMIRVISDSHLMCKTTTTERILCPIFGVVDQQKIFIHGDVFSMPLGQLHGSLGL